jgi:hypothetical protein
VFFLPGGPQFTTTVIPTVKFSQKDVEIRGREREGGVVAVSFQGGPVSALNATNP